MVSTDSCETLHDMCMLFQTNKVTAEQVVVFFLPGLFSFYSFEIFFIRVGLIMNYIIIIYVLSKNLFYIKNTESLQTVYLVFINMVDNQGSILSS